MLPESTPRCFPVPIFGIKIELRFTFNSIFVNDLCFQSMHLFHWDIPQKMFIIIPDMSIIITLLIYSSD